MASTYYNTGTSRDNIVCSDYIADFLPRHCNHSRRQSPGDFGGGFSTSLDVQISIICFHCYPLVTSPPWHSTTGESKISINIGHSPPNWTAELKDLNKYWIYRQILRFWDISVSLISKLHIWRSIRAMTYRRMLYIFAIIKRNHFKMYMFGVVGETRTWLLRSDSVL